MSTESYEDAYCAEQIKIPITFPHILKSFTKAAIRTQPYDLLRWASAYFRALANDKVPPIKERFEYPPFTHPTGLTPRYLKTLLNQLGRTNNSTTTTNIVTLRTLLHHWQGIVLSETILYQILMIGHLLNDDKYYELDLYRFLAVACGLISNNLFVTMIRICELFTDEPEGGSSMIPLKTFLDIYGYLAKLDCSSKQFTVKNSSTQNIEITSKSFGVMELLSSSSSSSLLFNNEKSTIFNSSISIEDLKSVCPYDEIDKSICELISNGSSECCVTMLSGDKINDDNIKCQNGLSVIDTGTNKKHQSFMENVTDVECFIMKEVTKVQDKCFNDIYQDLDDTVAVTEATVDEHVTINGNHENSRYIMAPTMIFDTLPVEEVTNEISNVELVVDDIKTDSSMCIGKSSTPPPQVGSDIVVGSGMLEANVIDNEKLVMMVNEVDKFKEGIEHIVTIKNKKQNQEMLDIKSTFKEICECHDEFKETKKVKESQIVLEQLPSKNEQPSKMISPSHDKVSEFIVKMKETTHPHVNYDVVGIGGAVSDERITKVGLWLTECSRQQGGHVGPRNLRHFLCPRLYDNDNDVDDNDINNTHEAETN